MQANTLRRVVRAIYDSGDVILVDWRLLKRKGFSVITKVRKTTLMAMMDEAYIHVSDDSRVHLLPKAVVMLNKDEQVKWMTEHLS